MEIFISWSGERSMVAAKALRGWLRSVLHPVRPWMSERDIPAGSQWRTEIGSRLAQARFGIICLTAENQHKPWLLFEAGALAKEMGDFVCPYLIDLEKSDVEEPLAQFQSKRANEAETRELVESINRRLIEFSPETAFSAEELEASFSQWWPNLEKALQNLPASSQSVPRRGIPDMLEEVLELSRSISRQVSSQSLRPTDARGRELTPRPLGAEKEGPELHRFREHIRGRRAALAGFMEQGATLTKVGNSLVIFPRNEIYIRYLRDNLSQIQEFASEFFGPDTETTFSTEQRTKI